MYMYVHLSDNNEFNIYVQVHQIINTKHSSHLTHNPLKQSILTLYRFFVYFYLFFFFFKCFLYKYYVIRVKYGKSYVFLFVLAQLIVKKNKNIYNSKKK